MTEEQRRHRVADVADLSADGSRIIAEVDGTEISVFRADGEFYALLNYCPHQAGPICEGDLRGRFVGADDGWNWEYIDDGSVIRCPWHGWLFDVTTGSHVEEDFQIPTYGVEIEEGNVYVVVDR